MEKFIARIDDLKGRLTRCLMQDPVFADRVQEVLSDLAQNGLDVRIEVLRKDCDDSLASYRAPGAPMSRDFQDSKKITEIHWPVRLEINAWHAPGFSNTGGIDELIRALVGLVFAHWGELDQKTLLANAGGVAGIRGRAITFAQAMAQQGDRVAILHTDLDKFKDVNTNFGEVVGDRVLAEFAMRFRQAFSNHGILLRTGGEEFTAILADRDAARLLEMTEQFRQRMETEAFPDLQRANTCSIGLAIYPSGSIDELCGSYDDLLNDAREAEQAAKIAGRNCIRLPVGSGNPLSTLEIGDLDRAAIEARIGLNFERPRHFSECESVVAGMLRDALLRSRRGATDPAISKTIEAIGLRFGEISENAVASEPLSATIPLARWAAVIGWSYFSCAFRRSDLLLPEDTLNYEIVSSAAGTELRLSIHNNKEIVEQIVLAQNVTSASSESVRLGAPWYASTNAPAGGIVRWAEYKDADPLSGAKLSPCLLLPIGDAAIAQAKALQDIVAGVVEIDDRPVIGGGLPDFWQSNVARVVRACLENPNIRYILAIGAGTHAAATLDRLKVEGSYWTSQIHDLQRRLSISTEYLQIFRQRALQVEQIESEATERLLALIAAQSAGLGPDVQIGPAVDLHHESRRRRLALTPPSEANRLSVIDGLRTATLADAYPQSIDLLRSADLPPQVETTQRKFREFPCFKLVLTNPFAEMVPEYWSNETSTLERYYRDNFRADEGIFAMSLKRAVGSNISLYEHALDLTVSALGDSRPTRRIMLPISAAQDRHDQPLGLCAIQILPRYRDGKWRLDFQWVWRTVEALVGFPFSAFGSVMWSKEFFDEVKNRIALAERKVALELGELTYVALSFHMFLDAGDTEIARAIVQDASQ